MELPSEPVTDWPDQHWVCSPDRALVTDSASKDSPDLSWSSALSAWTEVECYGKLLCKRLLRFGSPGVVRGQWLICAAGAMLGAFSWF